MRCPLFEQRLTNNEQRTTQMKTKLINVLLPLSLSGTLSYFAPCDIETGSFVEVPLGKNKKIIGVVWGDTEEKINTDKVKDILRVLDAPVLNKGLRDFIDWVANYTISPPGMVLKMAMSVKDALEAAKNIKAYKLGNIANTELTPSRRKVVGLLQENGHLTPSELKELSGVGSAVIKGLKDKGAIEEIYISPKGQKYNILPANMVLSPDQEKIAAILHEKADKASYSVSLLDGVTGSGKTEVYFSAIEKILQQENSQILIMLPEIALTTQVVARFRKRFGFEPIQWHSGLSPALREKNWRAIADGSARIVIGARSALFLPYAALKLIIIDEEHDPSYKQEEGVIYNARDMAVVRARIENIPLILVSATPSIETMANVNMGKYDYLHLPSRHGGAGMPDIGIIDLRKEKLDSRSWISARLKKAINDNLAGGRQSLLFLNRRGYAPLKLCRNCGYRFKCPSCSSWMVEHKKHNSMICHHCDYRQDVPTSCPECGKEDMLVSCGPGVERLAEEVKQCFPEARLALMTSDNLTTAGKAYDMIELIEKGDVDIIIGTQVIAKGHHFPNLTLVGIIDADLGMEGGDLRAAERSYQLLHQVSGRAGREKDKGMVLIQSCMPDNSVIQALASGKRDEFLSAEVENRKHSNMPPYSRLAGIILSDANEQKAFRLAKELVMRAPKSDGIRILGPAPAPIFLLRGQYRFRILIRAERNINIQKWIRQLLKEVKIPASVKVKVDVDPYSFM